MDSARAAARAVALRVALSVIALATVLAGLGFLFAAAYMFAVTLVGPLYAALTVGSILIAMGMVWWALARHMPARA
jgi:hypothetical protein